MIVGKFIYFSAEPRGGGREALRGGRSSTTKDDRFLSTCYGVSSLPFTYEGDCRDHRARRGQENPTASGEGRSAAPGVEYKLRVIANLSPLRIPGIHFVPAAPTAYSHRPVS